MAISDDERRAVARWAADAAERVLPLYELQVPGDSRPREALAAARAFASGAGRSRQHSAIALAAHRAGSEAGDAVALAAARAASLAAATANIHAEATIGTLGHILGPAAYSALARELAEPDSDAAGEELALAAERADMAVLRLVRRVPAASAGKRRLDQLQAQLDAALRRRA